ncbi:hypothetical protein HAV15_011592 [Penicillium sp. str. |nr:hypothetical protein HAV15_011592 [Penicillium sp. str. \
MLARAKINITTSVGREVATGVRAQGSAIPVFLGVIDLANVYFLHGAGDIRHMLLMGWGGGDLSHLKPEKSLRPAIERSLKEINSFPPGSSTREYSMEC